MTLKLLKEVSTFEFEEDSDTKSESGTLIVKGILQRGDTLNANGRIYPIETLKREVENYRILVKERRATGELDHCMSKETEILTAEGWKLLSDISENEIVYSLNVKNNNIERHQIQKKISEPFRGELYHITSKRKIDMKVTPNHRILLWDRDGTPYEVTAKEMFDLWLKNDSRLSHSHIKNTGNWNAENENANYIIPNTNFSVPKKAWAALLGLWMAEGFVSNSKGGSSTSNRIGITQKKSENVNKINALLRATELPWVERVRKDNTHDWYIHDAGLHAYFSQFGNSETKHLPIEAFSWNKSLLLEMLEWMLLGDGRNRNMTLKGEPYVWKEYSTISKKLADDVSHVMFLLGHSSNVSCRTQKDVMINGREILAENCKPLYTVSEVKTNHYLDKRFLEIKKIPYDDMVYCVTVQNHNFLARHNGKVFWTGNSDTPVVNLQNVSHVITDIWMEDKDVHGKVEILHQLPKGAILKGLLDAGIKVGISSRALGSVQSKHDGDIVQEDLHLICWDFVSEPSTPGAWMMQEAKEYDPEILKRLLTRRDRIFRTANDIIELYAKKNGNT